MDIQAYRQVLGQFATGITVIVTRSPQGFHGMTANSFTSVSLEPPMILVCIDQKAQTFQYLSRAAAFSISILEANQKDLSQVFANPQPSSDPFQSIAVQHTQAGIPYLSSGIAHLGCHVEASYPAGDHKIVVARVDEFGASHSREPLIFYGGQYRTLTPNRD